MFTAHKRCSYYWWQLSFYKQLKILVGFLEGLGVRRDSGPEKCHYCSGRGGRPTVMVKSRVLRSELKTLSPPPPSLVSFFTAHTLHPLFLLLLFSSSSHYIDRDCAKQGMWPSQDTYSAGAYSWCEPDLYPTAVHIVSSLALALPLLIPHGRLFWTFTELYPLPPCSLPSSWNTFCYISSRLLSYFSCHIGFLPCWRIWVPQCPSQSVMFRHKEVAGHAHWVITLTSLFWTCYSWAHLTRLCLHLLWSPEILLTHLYKTWDFPGGTSRKEPTCQCRRHKRCRFHPWVGKIPQEEGRTVASSIAAWSIAKDRGA